MFVVPIERGHPGRHLPYLVITLLILNSAAFVATLLMGAGEEIYRRYGFLGSDPSVGTLFSCMFLHGGFLHLLGNMLFLYMFGDNVEDVVGPINFLIAYLVAGVAATLAFTHFTAEPDVPLVGASGAISGIVGMYLVFFPKAPFQLVVHFWQLTLTEVSVTAKAATLAWFAEQFLLGLGSKLLGAEEYVSTAFMAHVGGFAAGMLLGAIFLRLGFVRRYDSKAPRNPLLGYVCHAG